MTRERLVEAGNLRQCSTQLATSDDSPRKKRFVVNLDSSSDEDGSLENEDDDDDDVDDDGDDDGDDNGDDDGDEEWTDSLYDISW